MIKQKIKFKNGILLQGDCLEILPIIKAQSIDMVMTDPPYGTTVCKWDSIIPLEPMWEQLKRLTNINSAIVMTASQPFTSALVMSNAEMFKHEWVWVKNRGSNFATLKTNPFKEHESVIVFSSGKINFYPIEQLRSESGRQRSEYVFTENSCTGGEAVGKAAGKHKTFLNKKMRNPSSVQKFNTEVGFHSTQKPVALMEYLIKTYTNEGNVVLDFAVGSGTTAIAANNLNRKWLAIEKDPEIFKICKQRLIEEIGYA